ncbi:MAG: membrane protein insertion efficiency factor YidD [Burkholderiaceae bacterium]|nr:membrane protein insertion efficiency factor YidD [Burkholderiaceae bacterium]
MPQRLLIALVDAYRLLLSPWLGTQCRFEPSCSAYAREALQTTGAATGSYLAVRRLLRCHPWCQGGHDPVPGVKCGASGKCASRTNPSSKTFP